MNELSDLFTAFQIFPDLDIFLCDDLESLKVLSCITDGFVLFSLEVLCEPFSNFHQSPALSVLNISLLEPYFLSSRLVVELVAREQSKCRNCSVCLCRFRRNEQLFLVCPFLALTVNQHYSSSLIFNCFRDDLSTLLKNKRQEVWRSTR